MSKGERSVDFVCPFYCWDRGLRIGCEGGCRVSFADRAAWDRYVGAYCGNLPGWEKCTLAQAREALYGQS